MTKDQLKAQNRILFQKREALAKAKRGILNTKLRVNRPKIVDKVIQLDAPIPRKPDAVANIVTKKAGCTGCSRQIRKSN